MKEQIKVRALQLAEYISSTKATVRDTSKVFGVSKSTVHKDVTERLKYLDLNLFFLTREVLANNLAMRHIRGGEATKQKYFKASKEHKTAKD